MGVVIEKKKFYGHKNTTGSNSNQNDWSSVLSTVPVPHQNAESARAALPIVNGVRKSKKKRKKKRGIVVGWYTQEPGATGQVQHAVRLSLLKGVLYSRRDIACLS
jgi:hypothetical protein